MSKHYTITRLAWLLTAALLVEANLGWGGAAANSPLAAYSPAASAAAPDGGPTGCRRGQLNAAPLAYRDLFFDNLENGGGNWQHSGQPDTWQLTTASSHSPTHSWLAQSLDAVDDQQLTMSVSASLPITPPSAGLAFWHLYSFRQGNADGGVVEYQADPGSPWQDAGPLFVQNGYTGVISGSGNPLNGRSGFVGSNPDNPQYTASILNLTTLLGHTPSFRFRLGTTSGGIARGWNIDDIEIYICLSGTPTPTIAPPTATPTNTSTPIGTPTPCGPLGCPTATLTITPSATPPPPTFTPTPSCLPACTSPTPTIPPTAIATDCVNPFVDIADNVFFTAIHYLNCRGVINGSDPTHYSPAGTSTRGQFAKVVALGFGLPSYTPTVPDFSDVPPGYFAYPYIESGFHAGILSGFDTASCIAHGAAYPCYLPNLPITREQLTKLVVGAGGYPLLTPNGGIQDFTDVPPSNVFYVSIETAYHNGIVNGYPNHTFQPSQSIRRDQMAQIVYEGILNRPVGGTPAPTNTPAATNTPIPWAIVIINDFAFNQQTITVTLGTTVLWTNYGNWVHTVTSDPNATESFASGEMSPRTAFNHTFTMVGVDGYYCTHHGSPGPPPTGMFGTVVVIAAPPNNNQLPTHRN